MTSTLKTHFNAAVELLEEKAALKDRIADWRKKATAEGLAPSVLLRLAKEHLQTDEARRRESEQAEIARLYRKELDLPSSAGQGLSEHHPPQAAAWPSVEHRADRI
jgi:hypothetical protein